ncbi:hypothetical protein Ahy_B10g104634 isoform E [Arachis hypogaea]|uniref:Uncharacterized protein n=1 Tax=Arachis hypogaea TaxID=3818 RepID=A0A444X618_ARAHY|nr:hypothetical protein Ahy_B10g104634 isoform E [Arachis hypogaea]
MNLLSIFLKPSTSFTEFQNTIIQKLRMQGMKWVEKLFYKILIFVLRDDVKYNLLVIGSDKDSQVLFHYHRQFSEVRTLELLAKLVDVVCSLGGLNRNPQPLAMASCSSSILVGVSASVPVIAPEVVLVASPSFAADLNRNCDGKIGDTRPFGELSIAMASTPDVVPIFEQDGALDGVKDVLLEDYDDDDVESATIADDRDDDIARSNPVGGRGTASSGTQQYPRAFQL